MPTEIKGSDSRETRVVSPVSKNSDEADDANIGQPYFLLPASGK